MCAFNKLNKCTYQKKPTIENDSEMMHFNNFPNKEFLNKEI